MDDDARIQDQNDTEAAPGNGAHADLPDRLRVHSLARVLGTTSRRVLDALAELDGRSRSAHSSVDRTDAVRVRDVLAASETPEPIEAAPPASAPEEPAAVEVVVGFDETPVEPTEGAPVVEPESRLLLETPEPPETPLPEREAEYVNQADYLPLFVAPLPVEERPKRAPAPVVQVEDDDDDDDDDDADSDSDTDPDADDDQPGRPANRRRRRGRRGRGRGRGGEGDGEAGGEDEPDSDDDTEAAASDDDNGDGDGDDESGTGDGATRGAGAGVGASPAVPTTAKPPHPMTRRTPSCTSGRPGRSRPRDAIPMRSRASADPPGWKPSGSVAATVATPDGGARRS